MTTKQVQVIKKVSENGGITGEQLKAIGYSDSIAKNPHKVIKATAVQTALQKALRKHKITFDRAIKPISDALGAEKVNEETGEITPDYNVQLKASAQALKLINDDYPVQAENVQKSPPNLLKAIHNSDEVELQRIIFSKTDTEDKE